MIIRLDTDGSTAELDRPDDLGAFHVEVVGAEEGDLAATIDTFGRLDDDGDHVWISVQAVREAALGRVEEGWEDRFQQMLEYAATNGWLSEDRASIRAHIERG